MPFRAMDLAAYCLGAASLPKVGLNTVAGIFCMLKSSSSAARSFVAADFVYWGRRYRFALLDDEVYVHLDIVIKDSVLLTSLTFRFLFYSTKKLA